VKQTVDVCVTPNKPGNDGSPVCTIQHELSTNKIILVYFKSEDMTEETCKGFVAFARKELKITQFYAQAPTVSP